MNPKTFLYWTTSIAASVVVLAAMYGYLVFKFASEGDLMSRMLATQIQAGMPRLIIRTSPTQDESARIALASVESGDDGACHYYLLRKCVAIQVDSKIHHSHTLFRSLIDAATDVCGFLRQNETREARLIKAYFPCNEPTHASVRVQLNVVDGLGVPASSIPVAKTAVTYARSPRKLMYQMVVENGRNG